MANRWNKVHVDIGTSVQKLDNGELEITGDVRLFQPHEACASCVGGIGDRMEAEIDLRLPAGVQPLRTKVNFHEQRAGSLVTINCIAISVAVDWITYTKRNSTWIRISMDNDGVHSNLSKIKGDTKCTICGGGKNRGRFEMPLRR